MIFTASKKNLSKIPEKPQKRVVITGGGTGGHIYPGLAIAAALEELSSGIHIVFVGASGGMEEKIFPRYKYSHYFISVGRLHSSVGRWQQIKTLLGLPFALLRAFSIYWKEKPDIVLGVGGFASGPFLFIAALLGTKTYLWEANAHPGLTNRMLSRFVKATFVVFDRARSFLSSPQIIFSGMPVRKEFFIKRDPLPTSSKFRVLVFGGSQGARFINNVIIDMVLAYPDMLDCIELVHQTGSRDYPDAVAKYGAKVKKMKLIEYIHDMPEELYKSDLVICRAGASTVAEVVSLKKPAIFIPLPTAADNHQLHNANVIAEKKGAVVLEQNQLDAEKLREQILFLKNHPNELNAMTNSLTEFRFENASSTIAQILLKDV